MNSSSKGYQLDMLEVIQQVDLHFKTKLSWSTNRSD